MAQLSLAFPLGAHAAFDTFVPGGGSPVLEHVRAVATGRRGETLWLWGDAGCGKTHLLQAACRAAGEAGRRSMYVPLGGDEAADADVLRGLDQVALVAVDDVERVAGMPQWERALFALLEARRGAGAGGLLLAAGVPPGAAGLTLADLASRAAGAIVYRLEGLDEDESLRALIKHARHRGLDLEAAAARYLLNRVRRDMRSLCRQLDALDRAAFAAKRRLTIPFIRSLIP